MPQLRRGRPQCAARAFRVDERAEARNELRYDRKRQRPRHVPAAVGVPLVDHEVGLVHELVGGNARAEIGAGTGHAVPPHDGCKHAVEQAIAPLGRVEHAGASIRQRDLKALTRHRIQDRAGQPCNPR